ncbi:hypothetical protein WJX77_009431 [Trebouxia sp. C0004]
MPPPALPGPRYTILAAGPSGSGHYPQQAMHYGRAKGPAPELCKGFARGHCRFGNTCRYLHESSMPPPAARASQAPAQQKLQATSLQHRSHPYQQAQSSRPSPVQFHNHKSFQTYASFVDTKLDKALAKGIIGEWPFPEPPTVVNGLKVVDDKLPKLRLCINPMYINLFLKYEPLKYDRLQDLTDTIGSGDFMSTSDDKSGY